MYRTFSHRLFSVNGFRETALWIIFKSKCEAEPSTFVFLHLLSLDLQFFPRIAGFALWSMWWEYLLLFCIACAPLSWSSKSSASLFVRLQEPCSKYWLIRDSCDKNTHCDPVLHVHHSVEALNHVPPYSWARKNHGSKYWLICIAYLSWPMHKMKF